MQKIVLTGGGTAGHIYPALAIAELLEKEFELHYIGSNGMEKEILAKYKNITFHEIESVKLERKLTLKNLTIPFKLFKSIRRSKKILKQISPVAIFSKGGYVALPVVIAGRKLKISIVSHESDLTMGLANKIILRFCDYMCTAFEETSKVSPKCIWTGQPIRREVLNGDKTRLSFYKNLDHKKKNLLVVGGSSGAGFLNKIVKENLNELCEKFNVIHICGKNKLENIKHKNYYPFEYAHNIGDFLNLSDLVISRAGSGAINEFLALQKPMLLIPLSKNCSRGDQIENAKLFHRLGHAEYLEEENFDKSKLFDKLDNLIELSEKNEKKLKKSVKIDICDHICDVIKKSIAKKDNAN
ncbi:MAG: undecaprenyldiphospho-muramoylpentapeptide beta-N-acetylglucosaminyltransferase [Clostridiales bacterium]|nr:undecaprenyldiphospho-muramoylpentapeptide beta-N-acetylglucosaminyltransferase [Clostridiales bacterium]